MKTQATSPMANNNILLAVVMLCMVILSMLFAPSAQSAVSCAAGNTITANVVVLDNPTVFNRLGAQNPNWITYSLKRDVVNKAPACRVRLQVQTVPRATWSSGPISVRVHWWYVQWQEAVLRSTSPTF